MLWSEPKFIFFFARDVGDEAEMGQWINKKKPAPLDEITEDGRVVLEASAAKQ